MTSLLCHLLAFRNGTCSISKATALMTYTPPPPTQDFEKGMTGTYHFCPSPKIRILLLSNPAVERYITND